VTGRAGATRGAPGRRYASTFRYVISKSSSHVAPSSCDVSKAPRIVRASSANVPVKRWLGRAA
jgi:hypothetical protein